MVVGIVLTLRQSNAISIIIVRPIRRVSGSRISANRIKKMLRNQCQNIGSEIAAENAAFMFSVTESCSLNGINPENYLEDVFKSILFGTDKDKRDFLPCYYQVHELPKMNALEVAKLQSTAA